MEFYDWIRRGRPEYLGAQLWDLGHTVVTKDELDD